MASNARFECRSGDLDQGFTLIEVVFSMAIFLAVALGAAELFVVATRANQSAQRQTATTSLAVQKMEQLRGLTWGFDPSGLALPLSDTTTDLSVDPPANNGTGLSPSPEGTLNRNTPGYVDYLDRNGSWVGTGVTPPATASYIRRWSITPLQAHPHDTLVLQVLVTSVTTETSRLANPRWASLARRRLNDDAWIVSVKTRKAP